MERRRVTEFPLDALVASVLLGVALVGALLAGRYFTAILESPPDAAPAGGRAACEPWPRDDGASLMVDPGAAAGLVCTYQHTGEFLGASVRRDSREGAKQAAPD